MWRAVTWRGRAAMGAAAGAAAFALPTAYAKPLPSPTGQKKLGLLRLEGWGNPETTGTGVVGYVPIPGDIDAKDSYDFAFIGAVAKGCTFEVLCDPARLEDPEQMQVLLSGVQNAIKRLVVSGAEAIVGNCGLFMWLHATGLIEQAVDKAMEDLGDDYARPYVMLSSLTTLAYDTGLASCHTFGEGQEKALVTLLAGLEVETTSKVTTRKCKVVVFTSNGDSCKELLNAIPQLKGLKVFFDGETEGDVLVVGLNGRVKGEKVPVIGLEGVSENGQVGGESVNGFNAVATGRSVLYDIVQPDIMLVAKAVKEKYPTVRMACVECTEVSAYSDTIREAMRVPVHDPINTAYGMMNAVNDHNFRQLGNKERIAQIASTLEMPFAELVKNGVLDVKCKNGFLDGLAQLPEEGASDDPLQDERQRARRAMQIQTAENIQNEALQALQAMRETLGDRHSDTLASISSMGVLLKAMGQLKDELRNKKRIAQMPVAELVKNGVLDDAQLPEVSASDDPLLDER